MPAVSGKSSCMGLYDQSFTILQPDDRGWVYRKMMQALGRRYSVFQLQPTKNRHNCGRANLILCQSVLRILFNLPHAIIIELNPVISYMVRSIQLTNKWLAIVFSSGVTDLQVRLWQPHETLSQA